MAFSTQRAVSDGTLVDLNLSFDYIDKADVTVIIGETPAEPGEDFMWVAAGTIRFSEPVPEGVEVLLRRRTQLSSVLNVFSLGASFKNTTIDENFQQMLYVAQEALEGSSLTDVFNDIDMHGFTMRNLANATDPASPVTLAQLQSYTVDSAATLRADLASNASNKGASLVTYKNKPLSTRLGFVAYVKDFGAVGDGVTDDTVAIQAAIDSGAAWLIWNPGDYIVTSLRPASDQVWYGYGIARTRVLWRQQNIPTLAYSMIQSVGDVQNFHVSQMHLQGNRAFQTTPSADNQDMGCFHLRAGSVRNVSVVDVRISEFGMAELKGDGTTAGHGALIGARAGTGKVIEKVRFSRVEFVNISNVPGVYINSESAWNSKMEDILLEDCRFVVDIATSVQNCIYILGDATTIGRAVRIVRPSFFLSKKIDCAIELNWIENFWIKDYYVSATDTGICTPVLIRDGSRYGYIGQGLLRKVGTGGEDAAGVALIRFDGTTGVQENIVIEDLTAYNWGTGGSGCTVIISAGSSGITVDTVNAIGVAGDLIDTAVVLGSGISNVKLLNINANRVRYLARYAGEATDVVIDGGSVYNSGDGVSSLITSNTLNQGITGNTIRRLKVYSPVAGTTSLVGLSCAANTGNRVLDNEVPVGMTVVSPGFLASQATIRLLGEGNGAAVLGNKYTFAQGGLSIANGGSFTIGANLDAQGPVCKPGDFVLPTFVGDALGATISHGYCPTTGQARFRVSNHTGATINIPAGNWNVLIVAG